ncbi:MAG: SDR family oxidoreductase [Chlorobi bacterium]|nr:SDR family oxidoreductase [Chlorobiota bacterium]
MKTVSFENLKDKTCVITGGGGVIGQALAKGIASVGIKIAILDIAEDAANKAAESIRNEFGVEAIGVKADVLSIESMKEAYAKVISELGQVDFLINGAGGNSPKATTSLEFIDEGSDLAETFFGLDIAGFDWVFNLNFKGTIIPTMVIAEDMVKKKQGTILNISSMNAFRPLTKIPAYSAAKASINNFTEWLSVHLAKSNVRVNAIAPGFFVTNQNRFLLYDEQTNELTPRGKKILDGTPMGKFGEVEDLVGTTLYLLSDLSRFVTGVVIPVDGGFNAYSGV